MIALNKNYRRTRSIKEVVNFVRSLPVFWSGLGVATGLIPVSKFFGAVMELGSNILMNILASVIVA
jgi:hypothetical protein